MATKLIKEEMNEMQLGALSMTLNMDEFCRVLELNFAKVYKDLKDCEYLKDVV